MRSRNKGTPENDDEESRGEGWFRGAYSRVLYQKLEVRDVNGKEIW